MLEKGGPKGVRVYGVGYAFLTRLYLGEASWFSFTEPEQAILRKTIRRFSKGLREAGFLPDDSRHEEIEQGGRTPGEALEQ